MERNSQRKAIATYWTMQSSLLSGCVAPHILLNMSRLVSISQKGFLQPNAQDAHDSPSEKCKTMVEYIS